VGRKNNPNVSAIQTIEPSIKSPPLNESGVLLLETEGDLLEVKEMDELYSHGFQSSFMQHHLANNPNVSAIPAVYVATSLLNKESNANDKVEEQPDLVANLPNDGPEVDFISRVNPTDTVVAHVDTGATVMVSNVHGEIHGAIPTTAHCGTAMTGSRATIDALGTWMVDLVGSVDGKDLPLALRGMTQITDFQQ
jgi:hypothetical protein